MKITYDASVDAAMIYIDEETGPGAVHRTEVVDADLENGAIVLDFDGSGRLVAIEILGASNVLPIGFFD